MKNSTKILLLIWMAINVIYSLALYKHAEDWNYNNFFMCFIGLDIYLVDLLFIFVAFVKFLKWTDKNNGTD